MRKAYFLMALPAFMFACDCSGQVEYAFNKQQRKIDGYYQPLIKYSQELTKSTDSLIPNTVNEIKRLNALIETEKATYVKLKEISFYLKKISTLPTVKSEELQDKNLILHNKIKSY